MPYSQRLKNLENQKQGIESLIADREQLSNLCIQDIKAETNFAKRTQLNIQMENYLTEITELYDKVDEIHKQINKLKST